MTRRQMPRAVPLPLSPIQEFLYNRENRLPQKKTPEKTNLYWFSRAFVLYGNLFKANDLSGTKDSKD